MWRGIWSKNIFVFPSLAIHQMQNHHSVEIKCNKMCRLAKYAAVICSKERFMIGFDSELDICFNLTTDCFAVFLQFNCSVDAFSMSYLRHSYGQELKPQQRNFVKDSKFFI